MKLFPDKQLRFSAGYELRCALAKASQDRRISVSEFIRQALSEYLSQQRPEPRSAKAVARELSRVPFLQRSALPAHAEHGLPASKPLEDTDDKL
jgi:hypothetical protein